MPLIIEEKFRLVELIPVSDTKFFLFSDIPLSLSFLCIHLAETGLVRRSV